MCPPGLAFGSASTSARSTRRRAPGRPLLLRLGHDRQGPAQGPAGQPFTPAVGLLMALDVALELIEEEGLDNVLERHAPARPRHPRRRGRDRPRAVRRPRTSAPTWSPPSRCPRTSTAPRCQADARPVRHHDRRRPGPAQGQDRAHRPLRLLRRLRHPHVAVGALEMALVELGHEVELGAGVGAAQRVFLDAGVPAAAPRDRSPRPRQGEDRRLRRRRCCASDFDVDLGVDWDDGELAERIGEYDGILIRSATKLTADLIERADAPAGDRPRRRGRGQRRRARRDQARHRRRQRARSPTWSRRPSTRWRCCWRWPATSRRRTRRCTPASWERSKFSGVELYEKTLGIVGFGRIGQLVAERARGFGMRVDRVRPVRGRRALPRARRREAPRPRTTSTRGPTSSPSTCPRRPTPRAGSTPRPSRRCATACASSTWPAARWWSTRSCRRRWTAARSAGAALDVFRTEPITEHPLFGYPNVIVTPHLGASTAEATDRAGEQAAEQVVAALTGGVVSTAVNIPAIPPEDMGGGGPVPAAVRAARPHRRGAGRGRVDRSRRGRVPRPPGRARRPPVDDRGAQRRAVRPHRGGGQLRQRPGAGRGARHRRLRDQGAGRARLRRPDPRDRRGRGRARAGRGHGLRARQPAAPARGLGAALQRADRPPRDPVPLLRRARDGGPRGHRSWARRGSTSCPPPSGTAPARPTAARR